MKKGFYIAFFLICSVAVSAQDVHFTQFYAAPLHLNPAFTGAGVCNRVSTNYRTQWLGVPNGYRSYALSIDHFMYKVKFGVGLMVLNDVAGTGNLKRTTINPLMAYETRVARGLTLRVGFQPTLGTIGINFSDLTFGDQIYRGGGVVSVEKPTQGFSYFDASTGALLLHKSFWFGGAVHNLLTPSEGFINDFADGRLPRKLSFHGGWKHILEGDEKDIMKQKSISMAFNYRGQSEFDQLDLGFYYTVSVFNLGFWYRGLPGVKAYQPGYGNSDAVAILVGIKNHRMNIGYSYDFTISNLQNGNSGGANELSFALQLCNPKKRRRKPRSFTPCPSF